MDQHFFTVEWNLPDFSFILFYFCSEENDHLKAENRSLKKDLLTAIENSASGEKKVQLKGEYNAKNMACINLLGSLVVDRFRYSHHLFVC